MKINKQKVLDFFKKSESRASVLLKDKSKASSTLNEAFGKAVDNKGTLDGIWNKLMDLFSLSKDYVNGNYTQIPKRSIIAIIGGLIYFLSPIDVIPDFILGFGFLDDLFILNLVLKQVAKDLEKYKAWKATETVDYVEVLKS
jgi:uncharacterized membrane protein YkvA (DUF1232 family)